MRIIPVGVRKAEVGEYWLVDTLTNARESP